MKLTEYIKNDLEVGIKFTAGNRNFNYVITDIIYPYIFYSPYYKSNDFILKDTIYANDIYDFVTRFNIKDYSFILRERNLEKLLKIK